ncbi:MAG: helix-turn-helix transcriptional regulator [Alcaligenaceae bacterium]|nr:helix-turn-helix transcriptional regulator [Alcaligenaceae bacterium]
MRHWADAALCIEGCAMQVSSEIQSSFRCTISSFRDSAVLCGDRSEAARLVFPATGVLIVSGEHGNWVVPSSRALWLASKARHDIRFLGDVRLKVFYFDSQRYPSLPDTSCVVTVSPLLREIFRTLAESPERAGLCRRSSLMGELMAEKIVNWASTPSRQSEPRDPRLAQICADIQLYPDSMKTLQQYAEELGCSERTLHRLFLDELGVSFTVWRHQTKLMLALDWLAQGRPIVNIALDLGYQNQGAFTTMFRKYLGTAPSRYQAATPRVLQ